jgi:hypothetical protein
MAEAHLEPKIEGKAMANKGKPVEAVAYIRTSSAANVGADKDSDKRQRAAIESFAKRSGFDLVAEYNAAVFHEYEKARLVAKLRAARERKRADAGKCEGARAMQS